jgi:predicted SAM-dependent methyltransferase
MDNKIIHFFKLPVIGLGIIRNEGWSVFWEKTQQRFKPKKQTSNEVSPFSKVVEKDHQIVDLNREFIAHLYLKGNGIEIGGLNAPLKVSAAANVKYVDKLPTSQLRKHYPELDSVELVDVDILDNGELLGNIADRSQDFVIANHFLEHCQNPIGAISNMLRVLKNGGILYMAVPDKRYTFDINRPVTTFQHLLNDYRDGGLNSKRTAFEEWVKYVNKITDRVKAEQAVNKLMLDDYSIHYHVWTQTEILHLFVMLMNELKFKFDVELTYKYGNETILILKKNN